SDALHSARHSGQPYSAEMSSSRRRPVNKRYVDCTRCTSLGGRFGDRAPCPPPTEDVTSATTRGNTRADQRESATRQTKRAGKSSREEQEMATVSAAAPGAPKQE